MRKEICKYVTIISAEILTHSLFMIILSHSTLYTKRRNSVVSIRIRIPEPRGRTLSHPERSRAWVPFIPLGKYWTP
jgi:hypothetical protein